jgi:hypothetical protein
VGREEYSGVALRRQWIGVSKFSNFMGVRLMRYVAAKKSSSQYFKGMDAIARRVRPISTI